MEQNHYKTKTPKSNYDIIANLSDVQDQVIALAGNPNVGKSTVFNALTGLKQHTGNWPGKTVGCAIGHCPYWGLHYTFVDLPGTYSLLSHSSEETIARDFICFGGADRTVVVCDATCLERNLNLALQIIEMTPQVVVCVNLMDEAAKKSIYVDLHTLEAELGVPVVGISARTPKGPQMLLEKLAEWRTDSCPPANVPIFYPPDIEAAIACILPLLESNPDTHLHPRWLAIKFLEEDAALQQALQEHGMVRITSEDLTQPLGRLHEAHRNAEAVREVLATAMNQRAADIHQKAVSYTNPERQRRDRKIDQVLLSKTWGIPIMLALLCLVFWITIAGANYPSQWLSAGFTWIETQLTAFFNWMQAPAWLHGALVQGLYRTLTWVIAVMLPPMAIFFPLFTLLEDFGYLPRIAFNLDHYFKKACACGKQALTMCLGFGCNAVGVTGCRIIDSPREKLIAILTNNFVPCNGRFPTLIAIISMFFVAGQTGVTGSFLSSLLLIAVILLGIFLTLFVSRLLSHTLLKGEPSSFALELPPYRTPQFGKVMVRSLLDRTLFVLGRAAAVAAPAGLLIWILANVDINGISLLAHGARFLDPFAQTLGLDGYILIAFILGFPANEIVVPILLMAYMSTGSLVPFHSLAELHTLLVENGWTWVTALSTLLFCLIHWPCSTTCLTIKKETGSRKWTALAVAIPTGFGMAVCFAFNSVVRLVEAVL